MKQLLPFSPLFTPGPAGAGTLDFTQLQNFSISKLYAVIDDTTGIPLYIAGAPGLGVSAIASVGNGIGSPVIGSVLTLQTNTSTCSTSDRLSVFYDTQPGFESNTPTEFGGQLQQLQELNLQMLRELVLMNYILAEGVNVRREDVAQMREDLRNPQNSEFIGSGANGQ